MTSFQKAAALAAVQVLFAACAGCSAGNPDTKKTPSASPPPPAVAPVPAPPASSPTPSQPDTAPAITTAPTATSAAVGASATFTVVATGGSLQYQWYRDGVLLAGSTDATYTTAGLTTQDNGATFMVAVINDKGVVRSTPVTLTVGPTQTAPSITTQPANASVLNGTSTTFTVAAAGTNVSYQWSKNGTAIGGATSASFTIGSVAWTDAGQYTVTVTNSLGAATSTAATLALIASPDQTAAESFAMNGGVYELEWNLLATAGSTQVSGTNDLSDDYAVMTQSPLVAGPQVVAQSATTSLASSLVVVASPTRILKNGGFLRVAAQQYSARVSFVGSGEQVDDLADDNVTVAYSQFRSGYQTVALSGAVTNVPAGVSSYFDPIFTNTDVLDSTRQWAAGSAILMYKAVQNGDRYTAFDCEATTTTATPSYCTTTQTDLTAFMTAGFHSYADNTTYTLSQGSIVTAEGVPVWVATGFRPNSTTEHRIYFALGGHIYTGYKIYNGTQLGNNLVVNGQPVSSMRLNNAAAGSLKAAVKL